MTPPRIDVTIEICGSSGDGSIAAGQILNLAMTTIGYHVMNFDSYPAEIRGFGKSVAHTRMSSAPVRTTGRPVDCLVALDDPHSVTSLPTLKPDGVILYDSRPMDYHEEDQAIAGYVAPGMVGYGVPLRELSVKACASPQARNIVALGTLAALFRIPAEAFRQAIAKRFAGKKAEILENNARAFDLGHAFGTTLDKVDRIDFAFQSFPRRESVTILSGNEAAAKGCLDAGIRFYAGYPITPATKIMEILAKAMPKRGGVLVQTEDEISAIAHVIGAGFAGRRAATATSGPGLCLMVECINLAVMAEVPVVVIDTQRSGPSTGMPTKTEQADLNLAALGGTGDSPRVVLAPTDVAECHGLTVAAFEVAEAFQTPVLLLMDFYLSNRMEDVDWATASPDRFGTYPQAMASDNEPGYKRFRLTDSGVSPRAVPGMAGLAHTVTGLEHNEAGLPDYSAANHRAMCDKRLRKLENLATRWPAPEPLGVEGELDLGIIAWGSTAGAAQEAVEVLAARGLKVGGLFPRLLWPLQREAILAFSRRSRRLMVAELNHTGQFAGLLAGVLNRELIRAAALHAGPYPAEDLLRRAEAALAGEEQP